MKRKGRGLFKFIARPFFYQACIVGKKTGARGKHSVRNMMDGEQEGWLSMTRRKGLMVREGETTRNLHNDLTIMNVHVEKVLIRYN